MFITLYPFNLLAESGSIVTDSPADLTGYPGVRLYDRSIDFYWKSAGGALTVQVDQGASVSESIDFLAITRHNLDTLAMQWQWSDNGSAWTDAVTDWTQSGNSQIIKTLASPLSHRYWKVTAASGSHTITEVWMSRGYKFQVVAANTPEGEYEDNVVWRKTYGDIEISSKKGARRRIRTYPLFHHDDGYTLASFRAAITYLDSYSKPFYIKDHEGDYWFCRLVDPSTEQYTTPGTTEREITVIEQL